MLTTFAQWLQTMAQTATSAAGQAGGRGDRLTSCDGRGAGASQHLLAVIDPAAPLPLPHTSAPHCPILTPQLPLSPGSHRACTVVSFSSPHGAHFALVACVLFLQGCSAVKLAYNQAPQLVYWRLNNLFQPDRRPGRPFAQRTGRPAPVAP